MLNTKTCAALFLSLLLMGFSARSAQSPGFHDAYAAIPDKAAVFRPGGDWFPYPAYRDREAWDRLTGPFREQILKRGKQYLHFNWELQRASAYLEYEKTGDRKLALPEENNRKALIALTLAELCEGKGRFLPDLTDGLWFLAQQYSWAHFEHTKYQTSRRDLPTQDEQVISLHGANTGACIAVAWHFFHEELDRLDPSISDAVWRAVEKQVFIPFLDESKDSTSHAIWTGFKHPKGRRLNNWNPYCNHHVLTAFLLMERDPDRLLRALDRSTRSLDIYMSDLLPDGACEEGPGYWDMSFGKVYDYARTLCDASGGRINLLDSERFRRMGEFKSKTYLADGWVMDYGDGLPRDVGSAAIFYRFGKDCGSRELSDFALYLLGDPSHKRFRTPWLNLGQLDGTYRQLETMRYQKDMVSDEEARVREAGSWEEAFQRLRAGVTSEWYPFTEQAVLRRGDVILTTKGGSNGESHNHNDVGSGILLLDGLPVLIDPGVGTYVKETFGPKRYTIWTMRSDWHNLPQIAGVNQREGMSFCARDARCDLKACRFSADIAGAYPAESGCKTWVRSYEITGPRSVKVSDRFTLTERHGADCINFIIRGEVALPGESLGSLKARKNEILLGVRDFAGKRSGVVRVSWTGPVKPQKEVKVIDDPRIAKGLGKEITRLRFFSKADAPLSGTYSFSFTLD